MFRVSQVKQNFTLFVSLINKDAPLSQWNPWNARNLFGVRVE